MQNTRKEKIALLAEMVYIKEENYKLKSRELQLRKRELRMKELEAHFAEGFECEVYVTNEMDISLLKECIVAIRV
ncbi:hypothetical protein CR513_61250, partial [Mucuna pruriens]